MMRLQTSMVSSYNVINNYRMRLQAGGVNIAIN